MKRMRRGLMALMGCLLAAFSLAVLPQAVFPLVAGAAPLVDNGPSLLLVDEAMGVALVDGVGEGQDYLADIIWIQETPVAYTEEVPPAEEAGAGQIILVAVLVGLLVALVVIRIMANMMNTVRKQGSAKSYEKGLVLTKQSDTYLYSHTTSQRIQSSNNRR